MLYCNFGRRLIEISHSESLIICYASYLEIHIAKQIMVYQIMFTTPSLFSPWDPTSHSPFLLLGDLVFMTQFSSSLPLRRVQVPTFPFNLLEEDLASFFYSSVSGSHASSQLPWFTGNIHYNAAQHLKK